jgi:HK97 family phage portal protein
MNLFKRLFSRGASRAKFSPSALSGLITTDGLFSRLPVHKFWDYCDYLEAGTRKVWATWRAIDIIANSVKTTPFEVLRAGSTTEVHNEGLERLLSYPNQNETWRDFIYKTIFHYRLTGMGFWYKSEANLSGDRPRNLYTLNPKRVEIVPDPETGIRGYLFQVDGRKIPFDNEEVILFRRPHPNHDVLGMGDIEPAEPLFNEFINRGTVLEKFYENGAQPSGLLINKTPNAPTEEEWEKAKKKWQSQYGGIKNAGKVAWLSGDWTYQQLGMSAQEMQDIERTKYTVEQIFLLHGVPLSVAGIRDAANYATADIDNQRFRQYTVLPDVLTLQDTINTDLVQGFDARAELRFNVAGLINADAGNPRHAQSRPAVATAASNAHARPSRGQGT